MNSDNKNSKKPENDEFTVLSCVVILEDIAMYLLEAFRRITHV